MADPVATVKVDWANNGNYTGTYDTITSDVLSFEWHRGGSDWAGGTQIGGATIRVKNHTGKYNPDNSGGVLYGSLLPGRPVHITAVYSATTYGIFGGYIDRIVPLVGAGGERTAELICVDAFKNASRRQAYLDGSGAVDITSVYDVRSQVATQLGLTTTLDDQENHYGLASVGWPNRDAIGMLEELNRGYGSRHCILPKSTPTGSVGWEYRPYPRTHKLSTAIDETFANVHAVTGYEVSGENLINSANVAYSVPERDVTASNVLAWTSTNVPFVIPVGTTYTVAPTLDRYYFAQAATVTKTGGTATTTIKSCGTMARISISATVSDVTVTSLSVSGVPSLEIVTGETSSTDSTSITAYGEQSGGTVTSPFLQTETHAKSLADYLLWRYKDPRKRPTITLRQAFPTIISRQLFDVIALTLTALSVSARRFEIVAITGRLGQDHVWSADFTLQETTEQGTLTDWFTLGTSALGGTHKLAL